MSFKSRKTSQDAFVANIESGNIGRRQRQVYEALYAYGPATRNQLAQILERYFQIKLSPALVSARLTELREMRVVKELGETTCPISAMSTILWDVTDDHAQKPPKKKKFKCEHCDGRGYFAETKLKEAA